MEGSSKRVSETVTSMETSNGSKGKARKWPIMLVSLGLGLTLLSAIDGLIFNFDFRANDFPYIQVITIALFAPLPYLFGVAFMYFDKRNGNNEMIKLSTLGGITLIVCIVTTLPLYYLYMSGLFANIGSNYPYPSSTYNDYNNYMNLVRLLQSVGIVASLIGAYYSLTKRSFKGALLAGGFSVFLVGNPLGPLTLIPIALGFDDFPKLGKKPDD